MSGKTVSWLGLAVALAVVLLGGETLRATGASAPAFTATTIAGDTISTPAPGDKPLLMFFVSTAGCTDCAVVAADVGRIKADYADRAPTILGVDIMPSDSPSDLQQWLASIPGADYHWTIDRTVALVLAFKVRAIDTILVIKPGGEIAFRSDRAVSYDALRRVLDPILS